MAKGTWNGGRTEERRSNGTGAIAIDGDAGSDGGRERTGDAGGERSDGDEGRQAPLFIDPGGIGATFTSPDGEAEETSGGGGRKWKRKGKAGWPKGKKRGPRPDQAAAGGIGGDAGSNRTKKEVQASVDGIAGILLSIHTMLASITEMPELALAESEAGALAKAMVRVAECYEIEASEKVIAWTHLAMCCGNLYGTRYWAIVIRQKREAEEKKRAQTPKLASFPGAS